MSDGDPSACVTRSRRHMIVSLSAVATSTKPLRALVSDVGRSVWRGRECRVAVRVTGTAPRREEDCHGGSHHEERSLPMNCERRPKGIIAVVDLQGEGGPVTLEPGWRWSESVRPIAGTDTCQVRHLGVMVSGAMHVIGADGSEPRSDPAPPMSSNLATMPGLSATSRSWRSSSIARPDTFGAPAAELGCGGGGYGPQDRFGASRCRAWRR